MSQCQYGNHPLKSMFAIFGLRKAGCPIINQRGWVRPGNAARSSSGTSRRESIKIRIFSGGRQ